RQIVAGEIVKAIVATGGGMGEREEAASNINAASSPQQLAGVIGTYQQLLTGKLQALGHQYEFATGRTDFPSILTPEARAYYQAHVAAQTPSATAPGAPAIGAQGVTPQAAAPAPAEITATGPNGAKLVLRGGRWVPVQ
ncbi:MAG: hypothetical protein ACREUG_09100, partial [Steroidobacteraceae bacterium]